MDMKRIAMIVIGLIVIFASLIIFAPLVALNTGPVFRWAETVGVVIGIVIAGLALKPSKK